MSIQYRVNQVVPVAKFIDLLERSGLAERRPVADKECILGMLQGANLLVTAWDSIQLVGVARALTDFHYCCYLSDLAVDREYQNKGIGRELIERTQRQLGPRCQLILLAAPAASEYYPHIGFERHDDCWVLPRDKSIS